MSIKGPQTPQTLSAQQQIEQARQTVVATRDGVDQTQAELAESNLRLEALRQDATTAVNRERELVEERQRLTEQLDQTPSSRAREAINRRIREVETQTETAAREAQRAENRVRTAVSDNQNLQSQLNLAQEAEVRAAQQYTEIYERSNGVPGTAQQAVGAQQPAPGGLSPSPTASTAQVAAPPPGETVVVRPFGSGPPDTSLLINPPVTNSAQARLEAEQDANRWQQVANEYREQREQLNVQIGDITRQENIVQGRINRATRQTQQAFAEVREAELNGDTERLLSANTVYERAFREQIAQARELETLRANSLQLRQQRSVLQDQQNLAEDYVEEARRGQFSGPASVVPGQSATAVAAPLSELERIEVVSPAPVRPVDVTGQFVFGPDGELIPADSAEGRAILAERGPIQVGPQAQGNPPDPNVDGAPAGDVVPAGSIVRPPAVAPSGTLPEGPPAPSVASVQISAQPVGGNYTQVYNPETGRWDVYNLDNPDVPVKTGLSEQAAILDAQNLSVGDPGYGGLAARNFGVAYDDSGFLLPGYTLDENNNPVYVGGDFVEPATAASAEASRIQALTQQAQQQATVRDQRKAAGAAVGDGDWRVRLRLAPNATYLYKTPGIGSAGIMEPLRQTDGVVFPYTPKIDISYSAEYTPYDLVHSNYRGYFYKGSRVGEVVMTADFTAQDSNEADYLLAVIHFFRSATKMFYGQDKQRGTPPPLVFLTGLGEFQFNEHPCVISQFNYNLPSDVDYIRARGRQSTSSGVTQGGNGLMFRRSLASSTAPSYSLSSIWGRLTGANLPQGGMNIPPSPPNLGLGTPTYVPTKISMSLTLLPMQTRSQVSQQFSLEKFANGNLLRGGFW